MELLIKMVLTGQLNCFFVKIGNLCTLLWDQLDTPNFKYFCLYYDCDILSWCDMDKIWNNVENIKCKFIYIYYIIVKYLIDF